MNDLSLSSPFSLAQLNAKLGAVRDTFNRTPRFCVVVATSPSTASQPFSVAHTLAVTPLFAIGCDDTGSHVTGFTDSDFALWNNKTVTLRSASASTKYRILIVGVN